MTPDSGTMFDSRYRQAFLINNRSVHSLKYVDRIAKRSIPLLKNKTELLTKNTEIAATNTGDAKLFMIDSERNIRPTD